jgi:hypothetical protein
MGNRRLHEGGFFRPAAAVAGTPSGSARTVGGQRARSAPRWSASAWAPAIGSAGCAPAAGSSTAPRTF